LCYADSIDSVIPQKAKTTPGIQMHSLVIREPVSCIFWMICDERTQLSNRGLDREWGKGVPWLRPATKNPPPENWHWQRCYNQWGSKRLPIASHSKRETSRDGEVAEPGWMHLTRNVFFGTIINRCNPQQAAAMAGLSIYFQ